MNNLIKGLLVAAAGVAVVKIVEKISEKKYAEPKGEDTVTEVDENGEEIQREKTSTDQRIKEAAAKMMVWIVTHKDQIEGVTAVIGLAASCLKLKGAISSQKHVSTGSNMSNDFLKALSNLEDGQELIIPNPDQPQSFYSFRRRPQTEVSAA